MIKVWECCPYCSNWQSFDLIFDLSGDIKGDLIETVECGECGQCYDINISGSGDDVE